MSPQPPTDINPTDLVQARELTHHACQWPSRAARANLPAQADDSHSNLGWDNEHTALLSHPLDAAQRTQLGFSFRTNALVMLVEGQPIATLPLADQTEASIQLWVDGQLTKLGLENTQNVAMPYQLESEPDYSQLQQLTAQSLALGNWFAFGNDVLHRVVAAQGQLSVHNPSVRCWPHHYDIGSLLTLREGDAETAPSIGLGFSPGDGAYVQPYFYCSPWPAPELADLPVPANGLSWHTEGFVSLVVTATNIVDGSITSNNLVEAVGRLEQMLV